MNDTEWRQLGETYAGDTDIAGDDQVGQTYSRRFTQPALPDRVIDVYYTVIATGADEEDDPPPGQRELAVIEIAEYRIVKNLGQPNEHESWSGEVRDYDADPTPRNHHDQAALERVAETMIGQFDPYRLDWDGEPFSLHPHPQTGR